MLFDPRIWALTKQTDLFDKGLDNQGLWLLEPVIQ